MNNSALKSQIIEAPLIIKDSVIGDNRYTYKQYITEILNKSHHFTQRLDHPFCAPDSQSHGECDSYAGEYGLDYKLISSKTALQADNLRALKLHH